MNKKFQWIALASGAIFLFAAGIYLGNRMANPANTHPEANNPASSSSGNSSNITPGERQAPTSASAGKSVAHLEIMRELRAAKSLPAATRNGSLLKALEATSKLPLSKDLLDELSSIVQEGEIESSHYVLSLMEQREEKESVAFLLKATEHPDPNIADRALFALEAVAGTVFKTREEAASWAANWQPDPERVKHFAPVEEPQEGDAEIPENRLPGPRSRTPKKNDTPSETKEPKSE